MTCTGTTCNQGRAQCRDGCHKPQRTCAELGVCQGRTPPCSQDCLPILHTRNSDDTSPHGEPFDWIGDLWFATKWTLIGAAIFASAVVALRAAGIL